MVTGTAPRAPWIVALGTVDKKQNKASYSAVDFWNGQTSAGVVFNVKNTAKNTPMKRNVKPTAMKGSTEGSFGKMLVVVLLPSMLKSTSCPKTHTPPMTPSTSWSTLWSTTEAKKVPVTITRSSGWNRDPELKPMGTVAWPSTAAPSPKAMSATARIIRKDSTGAPVKTCCPRTVTRFRFEIIHPLPPPSKAPAMIVATMRMMLASTSKPMLAEG
mmetsp:Transcript_123424/g.360411  ORF Transcript_123424/g.360411 Transcript_123424/m.360411 type:complete len:215 (-) Transcript_123424:569-1213(-)